MPCPRPARRRSGGRVGRLLLAACIAAGGAAGPAVAQNAPPRVDAPNCQRSVVLRIAFAFDAYYVPPAGQFEIAQLAHAMQTPPVNTAQSFDIGGHTDVIGRLGYNMGLSMLRAGAVSDALIAQGIPREKLRPQGFGPLHLFDQARPWSGSNRRVEVVANYC